MTRLCMDMDGHLGNISFHRGINTTQYDTCDPHDQLLKSLLETTDRRVKIPWGYCQQQKQSHKDLHFYLKRDVERGKKVTEN